MLFCKFFPVRSRISSICLCMKYSLLIAFVVFRLVSSGQNIVDTSYAWSNVIGYEYPFGVNATETIKFTADTLINQVNFKKVLRSMEETQLVWQPYGYIRESPDHKVYYKLYPTDPDRLIYDFTIQMNDSLTVSGLFTFNQAQYFNSITYHVTSIDTILIGSTFRKQFHLSADQGCKQLVEIEQWIEGFGSKSGILHNRNLLVGCDGYTLLCFKDLDTLMYQNPGAASCYISTGSTEAGQEKEVVSVFPNPFKDRVNFTFRTIIPLRKVSFILFNLCGEKVFSDNYYDNFQINLMDLTAGIYFYELSQNSTILGRGKLVKAER
jgi:hypothetical protein